jgi:N-acetylmuramoyl-L-alanine amidase
MSKIQKVEYLIIHHSASPETTTIDDIRQWHKNKGWSDIGYHKVIYQNGEVKQGRPDAVMGAQAFGANAFSLGICCIGNFETKKPPEKMIKALIQVLATLCKRHNLPPERIIGHRDVSRMFNVPAGASSCPGRYMYSLLPEIQTEVSKYLK